MKLLKLSMLLNYFAIAKNSKKAIIIINIGIFLSIFALTAASISIYIENKVSNLEFDHLENSRFKTDMEKFSQRVIILNNQLRQSINSEDTYERYIEFLRLNNFGKAIASPNDLQAAPLYFTIRDPIINEFAPLMTDFIKMSEVLLSEKDLEELRSTTTRVQELLTSLTKLNAKELESIIYDRNITDLMDEILEQLKNKSRLKFLKDQGKFEQEYNNYRKLLYDLNELFIFLIRLVSQSIIITDLQLKEINKEIINLSNKEKNIILSAFLLQLFIFIIIQFFEISSVNLTLKKRKFK